MVDARRRRQIRWGWLALWGSLVTAAALLVELVGCGDPPDQPHPTKIKHVVVIFQENRTPDNLFHGLPNADIAISGLNSRGETVPLMPAALGTTYDLDHSHKAFVEMFDNGKMDGADKIAVSCPTKLECAPPHPQFSYVTPSEVLPYFQLAEQYTFGDRMFQTNQGPSFPAHQFIISGTSAPAPGSVMFAAENPAGFRNSFGNSGCTAPVTEFVALIDPFGSEQRRMYPCFEHNTLLDLLDARKVSWRYYAPSAGIIWTAPNAIRHLRFGPDWNSNVVLQQTQVLTDISGGRLATVSWVIPTGRSSDHAGFNDGSGPSWVAAVVNAIGQSQYWSDTAIFITWDDWGGWYDWSAPLG